jgi:TRAP-type C4-dicarboxylate transport system substrate-binding protein
MRRAHLSLLTTVLLCAPALAQTPPAPIKLRMSAIGPEGTAWARELRAFGRDLEDRTAGRVQMKWYFGSIAGDEVTALDRIMRGQLDGSAGAQVCDRLAPSLRVTRVLGLFQSREESSYALGRLRASLDGEFRQSGFVGYVSGMGSDILFTRDPVRSLADLRKSRLWVWNLDEVMVSELRRIGAEVQPATVEGAGKAYEEGRTGGFIAIPTAALAFQWSSQTRYFTDLRMGFLPGCVVVANRVFDTLPIPYQQAFREAMAKLALRFEDLGRAQDKALLGGLFAKQGVKPLPASDVFRSEFFAAAREARAHIDPKLVSHDLLLRVEGWLADYRAEHR